MSDDIYRIKPVTFGERCVPILLQNINGPCPLLAISNCPMLASSPARIHVVRCHALLFAFCLAPVRFHDILCCWRPGCSVTVCRFPSSPQATFCFCKPRSTSTQTWPSSTSRSYCSSWPIFSSSRILLTLTQLCRHVFSMTLSSEKIPFALASPTCLAGQPAAADRRRALGPSEAGAWSGRQPQIHNGQHLSQSSPPHH